MTLQFHYLSRCLKIISKILWVSYLSSNPLIPDESSANEARDKLDRLFFAGSIKFQIQRSVSQSSNKFHTKYFWDKGGINAGIRTEGFPLESSLDLTRAYLWKKLKWFTVFTGSLKIETGQGLVYASPFGRAFRPSDGLGLVRSKWSFRPNLSSSSTQSINGVLAEVNFSHGQIGFLQDLGENESVIFSKISANHQHIGIIGNADNKKIESIIIGINGLNIKFSGEIANDNHVLSLSSTLDRFSWLIQSRWLTSSSTSIYSNPYQKISRNIGEKGIVMGFRYKSSIFNVAGGFDGFRPNSLVDDSFALPQRIWSLRAEVPLFESSPAIEFQEFIEMIPHLLSDNGLEIHLYMQELKRKASIQFSVSNFLIIKTQGIFIYKDLKKVESGFGVSLRTGEYKIRLYSTKISVHMFSTDSWDSRIYDYVPGLSGEFRLFSLYKKGIILNLVHKLKISDNSVLQFRNSVKYKSVYQSPEIQFGIQLNIGY